MNLTRRDFTKYSALAAGLVALSTSAQAQDVTAAEARAIAKEAYVYGFPLVDNYRVQYAFFIDSGNSQFKAPMNQIMSLAGLATPADTAVQTPNSDTLYSLIGLDLRTEPVVLTIPPIEKDRYFSVQLIDWYTYNFDYIGSRTTGNDGGSFLVAGPSWKGETPAGVKKAFRSETEFVFANYRTQLFSPDDLDNVKKIQAGYKVESLSAFLGQPAPAAAPAIDFIKPLTPAEQRTSLEFFNILNFVLQFAPTDPSETELMARFAKIGVGAGKTIDVGALAPEMKTALEQGMADAWTEFENLQKQKIDTGEITLGEMFGTREYLKNNYLYRMAAAVNGIYGNSKEEAMYPVYAIDVAGQKLNGANNYTVHFASGQLPPVNSFWSLTMYELPQSLLVANPLNRYLLNSPMLQQFVKDDGGITFYVQNQSPGKDKEPNWLPAPKGPFIMFMRLYWPKDEALNGTWKQPPLTKTQ
jgi:hypothetical protein